MSKGSENLNKASIVKEDKFTYVARDRIWKDHIEKINYAQKKWPENWGFLSGKVENLVLNENQHNFKLPSISLKEPERAQNFKSIPRTTSGWIGWKSTDEAFRLEKYGPYTKGRGSILKKLNWPSEAIS